MLTTSDIFAVASLEGARTEEERCRVINSAIEEAISKYKPRGETFEVSEEEFIFILGQTLHYLITGDAGYYPINGLNTTG
jgi:hypothetical protein